MNGKRLNNMERKLMKKQEIIKINENIFNLSFNIKYIVSTNVMAEKPYHHLSDGTFRNPEGSPKRNPNIKWSYKIFNEERKKLKLIFQKIMLFQETRLLKI